jgi:hypothetical protein
MQVGTFFEIGRSLPWLRSRERRKSASSASQLVLTSETCLSRLSAAHQSENRGGFQFRKPPRFGGKSRDWVNIHGKKLRALKIEKVSQSIAAKIGVHSLPLARTSFHKFIRGSMRDLPFAIPHKALPNSEFSILSPISREHHNDQKMRLALPDRRSPLDQSGNHPDETWCEKFGSRCAEGQQRQNQP